MLRGVRWDARPQAWSLKPEAWSTRARVELFRLLDYRRFRPASWEKFQGWVTHDLASSSPTTLYNNLANTPYYQSYNGC